MNIISQKLFVVVALTMVIFDEKTKIFYLEGKSEILCSYI